MSISTSSGPRDERGIVCRVGAAPALSMTYACVVVGVVVVVASGFVVVAVMLADVCYSLQS